MKDETREEMVGSTAASTPEIQYIRLQNRKNLEDRKIAKSILEVLQNLQNHFGGFVSFCDFAILQNLKSEHL